ncbi:MAG: ribbon-helix-helix protein, CopG family [Aeromicrobium sp.]
MPSSQQHQRNGWTLVSNSRENSLELTGVVHHVHGCGMNNGRNALFSIDVEAAQNLVHCQRCEAKLGLRPSVSRPQEGIKVEVRLQSDVLERIDEHAARTGATRAATIRSLIVIGLNQ